MLQTILNGKSYTNVKYSVRLVENQKKIEVKDSIGNIVLLENCCWATYYKAEQYFKENK